MAANNINSKYVELIREVRVTNIHASFATNSSEAVEKFFEVLNSYGFTADDICVVRASQYFNTAGDKMIKIYTSCMKLEDNDNLIYQLRRHVFNGKAWDAYASSKCLVLAASTDVQKQKQMVEHMVFLHRSNVKAVDNELNELGVLESQINNMKLTLNLRKNSLIDKADDLDKNGFN
jgi:hypothetical protein